MDRAKVTQSFVARIWLECGENGDPQWRGRIKHIQGQEEAYFQDLAQVSEFLEQVSGIPGPGLSSDTANTSGARKRIAHGRGRRKLEDESNG